ncbi:acyltransferase family protein [Vibrio gazogenes]|uniref:acyltransferase family protein n=1 Tax=Vibrio gazogenes TaxID=687 RepID=UPI0018E04255|nr:acyltransferase family protein [Vibrio gazogenes]
MNQVNQVNQSSPYNSAYRTEIDGLRAFAVLSVVIFHAFPTGLKGGFVGVDVFFVISGFLITSHIFENLASDRFSLTDFYGRRIRRIFPALILVMACSLAFGWFVLLADELNQLGKHVASGAAFISNFIFASEVGYFDTASDLKPMLHLWSLAVEEQFYIFFPLLLLLASKLRINLLMVCLVVLIASFSVNIFFVDRFPTEMFFWPFGRFWELLTGSVLAWVMLYKPSNNSILSFQTNGRRGELGLFFSTLNKRGVFSLVGLLILVLSVVLIDRAKPFPSYWAIFPVLGAVLIIIGGSASYVAKRVLCNRVAVWFGLISYPLYLWHWPILSYFHIIEDGTPHRNKRILAVALSVALAWITFQFVEKPIRYGNSIKSFRTIALVVGSVLIGLVGFSISKLDLKETNGVDDVYFREGLEHRIGATSRWYEGLNDWLFLGNSYNDTVAKLKLAIKPSDHNISEEVTRFNSLAEKGSEVGAKVALLVGPNKSSVYGEDLPKEIKPSETRYISYFTNQFSKIDNLYLVDPTELLIRTKKTEGLVYWRTDTHWNQKGAYIAFTAMMEKLGLNYPRLQFNLEGDHKGDLIGISNLNDFPIHTDDNWSQSVLSDERLEIVPNPEQADPSNMYKTGWEGVVKNKQGLNKLVVWVLGDSFANSIKPYLNASFSNVKYLGHWHHNIDVLPSMISDSIEKPDLVFIVRVERSF